MLVDQNRFRDREDHMRALMVCVVTGLLMGRYLTASIPEFAVLFIVSIAVSLLTLHWVSQWRVKLQALAGYCCSVMIASTQMMELVRFAKGGYFLPLLGEIPELIIGGFMVPAMAIVTVHLFMIFREA